MAPIEMKRMKKALGIAKEQFQTFQEVKNFFILASELVIPDFMNAAMSFPEENILHWEFKSKKCFAYKGMVRTGAIDQYECGVIYRIECWMEQFISRIHRLIQDINLIWEPNQRKRKL